MHRPSDYIRYVPAQDGAQPKIIQMVEVQKDPLEPPRFKINQKVPRAPPSPPAPVMHSPPRKITAEEQKQWKIPPCVSSWKNPRGYTVPLDKRCAFNGRTGAQPETINPKFAQLSETLYISTRQHRDALEERMRAEKLMAQKEKEKNVERLRMLAQQAREERAAVQRGLGHGKGDDYPVYDRTPSTTCHRPSEKIERRREASPQRGSGHSKIEDYRDYNKSSFATTYKPSAGVIDEQTFADRWHKQEDEAPTETHTDPNDDPLAPIQFEKDDAEDVFNVESFLKKAKYNARKLQESSSSSKRHK